MTERLQTLPTEPNFVLTHTIADLEEFEPDKRIRLASLAMRLGEVLVPHIDAILMTTNDFDRTKKASVEHGLYIERRDPRYKDADLLAKNADEKTFNDLDESGLKLPFRVGNAYWKQPGVVFNPEDYDETLLHPGAFVARIKAKTRYFNSDLTDVVELDRRTFSAAAQALEKPIIQLQALDTRYVAEHQLVTSLHKQTRGVTRNGARQQNQYKGKNLDKARLRFEEMRHDIIDTAAVNNGWNEREIAAAHNADAAEQYRGLSKREIDTAWRQRLEVQGLYINARRFKIVQALSACLDYDEMYGPYVKERREAAAALEASQQPQLSLEI